MATIYFFGDSWPVGCELELATQKPYPKLVGEMLTIPTVNCATGGSSQLEMLPKLLSSQIQPNDVAIFALTSPSRRFYYESNPTNCSDPIITWDFSLTTVNDFNDTWMAGLSVYALYSWCLQHQVTPYFFNLFTTSYNTEFHHLIWEEIPEDVWMLPKDTCVARELYDPEWYKQWDTLRNGDFADWLVTNNTQVNKYIKPCINHPNQAGHLVIAEMIVDHLGSTV